MAYKSCPHCTFGTIRTIDGSQQSCGMCGGTGSIWTPDPVSSSGGSSSAPRSTPPRFQQLDFNGVAKYEGKKILLLFPHGEGKATLRSGIDYTGNFSWGNPHGKGIIDASGYRIEGSFRRGMPHGDCFVAADCDGDGAIGFICKFRNSYPKGEGVLSFPDGSRFEGKWNGHDFAKGQYIASDESTIPATIRDGALRLKKSFFKKPVIARFSTFDIFTGRRCSYDPQAG